MAQHEFFGLNQGSLLILTTFALFSIMGTMKRISSSKISITAILVAIIFLLALTPFGYIKTLGLSIQLITIPVAVGTCVFGANVGLVLGLAFGLSSFVQAFGLEPFGTMLFSINPVGTFIMCIIPRLLAGFLPGIVGKKIQSLTIKSFVVPLLVAVLNTIFFMTLFVIFFWNTDFVQSLNSEGKNIIAFVIAFVGINGVVEWVSTTLIGGAINKAVFSIQKK